MRFCKVACSRTELTQEERGIDQGGCGVMAYFEMVMGELHVVNMHQELPEYVTRLLGGAATGCSSSCELPHHE